MTSDILKRAAEAVKEPHRIYINRAMVFDEGVTFTTVAGLYPHAYVPEDSYIGLRTLIHDMAAAIAERDEQIERLTARAEAAEAILADAGALRDAADRVSAWFATETRHLEGPRINGLRMAMVAYDRHMQPAPHTAMKEGRRSAGKSATKGSANDRHHIPAPGEIGVQHR